LRSLRRLCVSHFGQLSSFFALKIQSFRTIRTLARVIRCARPSPTPSHPPTVPRAPARPPPPLLPHPSCAWPRACVLCVRLAKEEHACLVGCLLCCLCAIGLSHRTPASPPSRGPTQVLCLAPAGPPASHPAPTPSARNPLGSLCANQHVVPSADAGSVAPRLTSLHSCHASRFHFLLSTATKSNPLTLATLSDPPQSTLSQVNGDFGSLPFQRKHNTRTRSSPPSAPSHHHPCGCLMGGFFGHPIHVSTCVSSWTPRGPTSDHVALFPCPPLRCSAPTPHARRCGPLLPCHPLLDTHLVLSAIVCPPPPTIALLRHARPIC
jgi:hypothetical protein